MQLEKWNDIVWLQTAVDRKLYMFFFFLFNAAETELYVYMYSISLWKKSNKILCVFMCDRNNDDPPGLLAHINHCLAAIRRTQLWYFGSISQIFLQVVDCRHCRQQFDKLLWIISQSYTNSGYCIWGCHEWQAKGFLYKYQCYDFNMKATMQFWLRCSHAYWYGKISVFMSLHTCREGGRVMA